MEIAPYLYQEFGYSYNDLLNFMNELNYKFYDENVKEISNIIDYVGKIKDGSSKNFFLV